MIRKAAVYGVEYACDAVYLEQVLAYGTYKACEEVIDSFVDDPCYVTVQIREIDDETYKMLEDGLDILGTDEW
jgi:hypothetical protein